MTDLGFRLLILAAGCLTFGGCVGWRVKPEVIFCDPSFGRTGVAGRTVLVAGVVLAADTPVTHPVQIPVMQQDLESALRSAKIAVHEMPHQPLIAGGRRISRNSAQTDAGPFLGLLNPVEAAGVRRSGADLMMMIGLTGNRVDERVSRWERTETDDDYDEKGQVTSSTTITTYTTAANTGRQVIASHYLFDVATGKLLWRSHTEHEKVNSSSQESHTDYPDAPIFRSSPSEAEVVRDISQAAVKRLKR